MATPSTAGCESAKADKDGDRFLGDGDGLCLRIRPNGTKAWRDAYELNGRRTKYTIGIHQRAGAQGDSMPGRPLPTDRTTPAPSCPRPEGGGNG